MMNTQIVTIYCTNINLLGFFCPLHGCFEVVYVMRGKYSIRYHDCRGKWFKSKWFCCENLYREMMFESYFQKRMKKAWSNWKQVDFFSTWNFCNWSFLYAWTLVLFEWQKTKADVLDAQEFLFRHGTVLTLVFWTP